VTNKNSCHHQQNTDKKILQKMVVTFRWLLCCWIFFTHSVESFHFRRLEEEEQKDLDDYQIQMANAKAKKAASKSRVTGTGIQKRRSSDETSGGGGSGAENSKRGERAGKWKENFALLTKYKKEHGNVLVPLDYEVDDAKLGRWLKAVQRAWEQKKLPSEKIDQLKSLGVSVITQAVEGSEGKSNMGAGGGGGGNENMFNDYLAALKQYKKEKGTLEITREYETSDGLKLGRWLGTMLVKAKRGELEESKHRMMTKTFAELGLDFEKRAASLKTSTGPGKGGGGAKKTDG
jgi:hypothetical protein